MRASALIRKPLILMRDTEGPEDAWPEFVKLWQSLRVDSREPGTVIVVEGERDRLSLNKLGIRGRVVLVHHGQSLGTIAQELVSQGRRVIVLTDWDLEGGHLARRLKEFLEADSLKLDLDYRRRLAHVLRGEVVHVEGLARWAGRMADRLGAPLEHFLPPFERG